MMQDFRAKNQTREELGLVYTQEKSLAVALNHTCIQKGHALSLQKLGKNAWAHTLYEHTGHVYTY